MTQRHHQNSKKRKVKLGKKDNIKSLGEELGISELLAIAEGKRLNPNSDSESTGDDDNEQVKTEQSYSVPNEGVQVTIELPNMKQKKKSKGFDMEAALKRRLNLIRKENQVLMHKVHVLCWLAHGIYLNRIVNSDDLMGLVLSLIPSKHCYPSKHFDFNYLEKLVQWFVGKVNLDKNHKFAKSSTNLSLLEVLEQEINMRVAFTQRDLVLIFISMIRSLGINARLVISLRPVPLRPPASDLCQVNSNKKEETLNCVTSPTKVKGEKVVKPHGKVKSNLSEKKRKDSNLKSHLVDSSHKNVSDKSNTKQKLTCSGKKSKNITQSEVKSPYFSSSDEVSLQDLINKDKVKSKPSLRPEKKSATNKSLNNCNVLKCPESDTFSRRKGISKNVLEKDNASNIVNVASQYFGDKKKLDSNKHLLQKQKVADSKCVNNYKKAILGSLGVKPKRTKSQPVLFTEPTSTSSEDEVKIPQKKSKVNAKQSSNSKLVKQKTHPKSIANEKNDHDFELSRTSSSKNKSIDRRVLSSDDENSGSKKIGNDFWAEVFLESEEKWISVDLTKGKVHCVHQLYSSATHPVRYVIAWNNDGTAKDLTRRYAPQWLTITRRLRADETWWKETMAPYRPPLTYRERDEDEDLDRQMHDKPLPTSVTDYKNHPLFALKRHLLKFQAIYPPDAPTLGFVRGEPVYSRGCVVELHTREAWMKEAKLVRRGEDPYKIVKARPKWDKLSQTVINDLPLPLFGYWQVEDYIPPPAVDGKVPRNEYGNVELYKPCMLPPGTVHLQVPQLARVARKLDIDCAPAVVGWEFSGGGSHPVLDGFIVCEEFKDVLLDAWDKEMDESAKRAKEKVEHRVYGNWKRLIKGLLIRERLKARYDFGVPIPEKNKKKQPKPGTSKS